MVSTFHAFLEVGGFTIQRLYIFAKLAHALSSSAESQNVFQEQGWCKKAAGVKRRLVEKGWLVLKGFLVLSGGWRSFIGLGRKIGPSHGTLLT